MRQIDKGMEPRELTEYKRTENANYDDFRPKDCLRDALVAEQRGLCCYCMSRIRATEADMKIEHCISQEQCSALQLNYHNLLGACKGGQGKSKKEQHCDTAKGGQSLTFNPADPEWRLMEKIRFLGSGEIVSTDPDIQRQLGTEVLNLNLEWLKANRKATLTAFQQRLAVGKKLDAAKELPKWDGGQAGELPEYAEVIASYLRKKLKGK